MKNYSEEHSQSWFDAPIPPSLKDILAVTMKCNPNTIQFFACYSLTTAHEIVTLDTQSLTDILKMFSPYQLTNPDFITFVSALVYLATYLKELAQDLHQKDSCLMTSNDKTMHSVSMPMMPE